MMTETEKIQNAGLLTRLELYFKTEHGNTSQIAAEIAELRNLITKDL